MRNQSAAIADQSSAVIPPVICNHPDDVAEVRPESGYRLSVRFFDGTSGIVDLSDLITSSNAGVFAALADPQRFAEAGIALGAVTWPNGLDLAPDAMYAALRSGPIWKPE